MYKVNEINVISIILKIQNEFLLKNLFEMLIGVELVDVFLNIKLLLNGDLELNIKLLI